MRSNNRQGDAEGAPCLPELIPKSRLEMIFNTAQWQVSWGVIRHANGSWPDSIGRVMAWPFINGDSLQKNCDGSRQAI